MKKEDLTLICKFTQDQILHLILKYKEFTYSDYRFIKENIYLGIFLLFHEKHVYLINNLDDGCMFIEIEYDQYFLLGSFTFYLTNDIINFLKQKGKTIELYKLNNNLVFKTEHNFVRFDQPYIDAKILFKTLLSYKNIKYNEMISIPSTVLFSGLSNTIKPASYSFHDMMINKIQIMLNSEGFLHFQSTDRFWFFTSSFIFNNDRKLSKIFFISSLHAKKIIWLIHLIDDNFIIYISFHQQYIWLKLKNTYFTLSVYWDYKTFPSILFFEHRFQSKATSFILNRIHFIEALNRVKLFAIDNINFKYGANFYFFKDKIDIFSNSQKGSIWEKIHIIWCLNEQWFKDIVVSFNIQFILSSLKLLRDETFFLHIIDDKNPIMLSSIENPLDQIQIFQTEFNSIILPLNTIIDE